MKNICKALGLMSYEEYSKAFENWVANGQTSGSNSSAARVAFTRLNHVRTRRLQKTMPADPELKNAVKELQHQYSFVVLTEAWCGDSAQVLPFIADWVSFFGLKARLFIALRDEHPALVNLYHTNGAKAIPKLIIINETLQEEAAVWGPRPAPAQQLVMDWKANPDGKTWEMMELELHNWYTKDKGQTMRKEWIGIMEMLQSAEQAYFKKSA